MELFTVVLGLAAIYSWVHGAIIVGKKITGTTTYENAVLIFGLVMFTIIILDIMFR
jgi:hypothetical protein